MKNRLEILFIFLLFIILVLFFFITPNMNTDMNIGKLIINEVMLINNNTITDKFGKYNDYIELYNGNDFDVNLYGYYLTDNMKETRKWEIPDVTIKSHDYLIIYASGKDIKEGELHTNFKLDAKGETVALSNSSSKVISKVYVKETYKDTSYGYNEELGRYVYYYNGTPNALNKGDYSLDPIYEISDNYKLRINEYMTDNVSYKKASDNKYYSLIEIYNYGDTDINLEGFYLSDKLDDITKYTFPNITIKKDEYLVVYASGNDTFNNNEVHTNFKLNKDDGCIVLVSPNKSIIDKVNIEKLSSNLSYGFYEDKYYLYNHPSFGDENKSDFVTDNKVTNNIIINEVSIYPKEAIELYNKSDDIKLDKYSIGDKSGTKYNLSKYSIKKNGYLSLNNLNFSINNTSDIIYLYYDDVIVDTFDVGKIIGNISVGRGSEGERVYYKNITLGSSNSTKEYLGFSPMVIFDKNGGYIEKNSKVSLSTNKDYSIYYTTDGSFPTINSLKYSEPINISKNMVIKAISYKEGYIESNITSRTFIVDRKPSIPFVSITSTYNNLFGGNGLITNYTSNSEKKVNVEYFDEDGLLAFDFLADAKLSGMDSRREPQKSISIYLRKKYGTSTVTYPFFNDMEYNTYSSLLFRNSGEDPKNVRIMDAALTRLLKGQMDIDMQEYRPVVIYLNGSYYGIYNLREKLNGDYVESKFNIDKDDIDLIKYSSAVKGSTSDYNKLVSYIKSHDTTKSDVYEYLKTQIDMEELINYFIVESFYGNTDLGNIRYWKSDNGKWRWMLYDLDWSLWNSSLDMGYPIKSGRVPAATYLSSSITIVRNLYKNKEFKDLYLKSLSKYLKETFKPDRFNKIVDELVSEIEEEMSYHIKRWGSSYPGLNSVSKWHNNISSFKKSYSNRYNKVINNLKSYFNLSNSDYNKYFGDLK